MQLYCFKCGNEVDAICARCLCREAFQVVLRQIETMQAMDKELKELKAKVA